MNWHSFVPREPHQNVLFRRNLLKNCRETPGGRAAILEACRQDPLFWINAFVWQFNPRKKGAEVGPFTTWDFQERALLKVPGVPWNEDDDRPEDVGIFWAMDHDEDLLLEKSREMGASWLCLLAIRYRWQFRAWQKFLVISRNETLVDDSKEPDSLFWKIDFCHRYMPDWMMPRGWDPDKNRQKLVFYNPENDSTISGEASTGKAGVGGRATAMFIDEFSQIREDYEVLHRTSDTTGCRIFNGTHKGHGTAFHELSQRVDMKKLVLHWSQHPDKKKGLYRYAKEGNKIEALDKNYAFPEAFEFVYSEAPAGGPHPGIRSPWYDRECLRKGSPRAVAMDLDIDPGGSVAQFFNPLTLRVLKDQYSRPPYWEGELSYDRDTGKPQGLVKVPGGALKLWLSPRNELSVPASLYAAGADLSAGQGATNSVLCIADARTGEKVASYATPHVPPKELAALFVAICWLFKDSDGEGALFAWEHAGPGQLFGKTVLDLGYRNIYYREGDLKLGGGHFSQNPGWYPTNQQKRILLDDFRSALDSRQYVERDELVLKEALAYRFDPQGNVVHPMELNAPDPTGAGVNHGDRVIAAALAWKMVRQRNCGRARPRQEEEGVAVGSLAWRRLLADNAHVADPWAESTARLAR